MIILCGIVYKSNFHTSCDYQSFINACETLNHRGPDDFGYLFKKNHSFGHKRLSIIDIENGKQPMSIMNHHLIYNGELYNIEELKNMLDEDLEYSSDTYLLLKLLMKYGKDILDKLNGIFSFVYVNNDDVLIVRDMFGVKPLYYSFIDDDIIVGSEIKAILAYKKDAVITNEGLCELLGMGPSHSVGKTLFKGIYELEPGHFIRLNKNGYEINKYYDVKAYLYKKSYKECVNDIHNLLEDIVNNQINSDVGVSSFLSGGLDSSIISTLIAKKRSNLDCYTIDYEDNLESFKPNEFEISRDYDYACLVSKSINSYLHLAKITNDMLIHNLKEAVIARDAPGMTDIDSSMLYISEIISKNHKVSLSGECADELFGGYSWFYKNDRERKIFPWIRNIEYRQLLLSDEFKKKLDLKGYVEKEYNKAIMEAPIKENDTKTNNDHRIMTYLNMKYFMTNLLDRKDRMTMNKSIEVRVPFCDKRLVEELYNIPFKYKYRYKKEKKLLRDAFKKDLDKRVINRKKSPYPKSMSAKYDMMVKDLLLSVINDNSSVIHRLFDINMIKKLIEDDELKTPWYGQLMRKTALMAYIYQIDFWFKKYNVRIED